MGEGTAFIERGDKCCGRIKRRSDGAPRRDLRRLSCLSPPVLHAEEIEDADDHQIQAKEAEDGQGQPLAAQAVDDPEDRLDGEESAIFGAVVAQQPEENSGQDQGEDADPARF
jgi:hypothetical protein